MRASFHTFGCKLNQFETEALASAFRSRGFGFELVKLAAEGVEGGSHPPEAWPSTRALPRCASTRPGLSASALL